MLYGERLASLDIVNLLCVLPTFFRRCSPHRRASWRVLFGVLSWGRSRGRPLGGVRWAAGTWPASGLLNVGVYR